VSRQFSFQTILRQVSNALLREFCKHQEIDDGTIEWESLGEYQIDPLLKLINNLSREKAIEVEGIFQGIFELACTTGRHAICEASAAYEQPELLAELSDELDAYDAAMWTWLNYPDLFDPALRIHEVATSNWWRRRHDLPRQDLAMAEHWTSALEQEISALLRAEQGIGRHCTVEHLIRNKVHYFFVYADDQVERVAEHDNSGKLHPHRVRRTFEILFAYTPAEGALEVSTRLPHKIKEKLEVSFARIVAGTTIPSSIQKPTYHLDHVVDRSFVMPIDPEDRLEVAIKRIRLEPGGTSDRITLECDPDDLHETIHDKVENYLSNEVKPPAEVKVTLVTFRFRQSDNGDLRGWSLTFDVVTPHSCSLRNQRQQRVELLEKYLRRWRILGELTAAPTPSTAGV
jgi:hypothetical protein